MSASLLNHDKAMDHSPGSILFPSHQSKELNKPLFFINYPVSGVLLRQRIAYQVSYKERVLLAWLSASKPPIWLKLGGCGRWCRLTCLVLGVPGKLNDQGLVVLLGIRELRLHPPFVIVSKHLRALAVLDEILVMELKVFDGLHVILLSHRFQLEANRARVSWEDRNALRSPCKTEWSGQPSS